MVTKVTEARSRAAGSALRLEWLLALGIAVTTGLFSRSELGRTIEERVSDRALKAKTEIAPCPAAAPLTLVELDDRSLEREGRWPWARQQIGELVAGLAQLGARSLFLDIEFPEASEAGDEALARAIEEARHRGTATYGVSFAGGESGGVAGSSLHDESDLEEAIAKDCSTVIPADAPPLRRLVCHLRHHPMDSLLPVLEAVPGLEGLTLPPPPAVELPVVRQFVHTAALRAVTQDPRAGTDRLVQEVLQVLGLQKLGPEHAEFATSYLPRLIDFLKTDAARLDRLRTGIDRVRIALIEHEVARQDGLSSSGDPSVVTSAVLGELGLGEGGAAVVRQMVLRHRALNLILDRDATPHTWTERVTKFRVVPPTHRIAVAYSGVGSSSAQRDRDGVLRRMSLFFPIAGSDRSVERSLPQAVLPMIAPLLSLDLGRATRRPDGKLAIPRASGSGPDLVIPVDDALAVQVNWRGRWREDDFPHVSASAILDYARIRAEREETFARHRSPGKAQHPEMLKALQALRAGGAGPAGGEAGPLARFVPGEVALGWEGEKDGTRAEWIARIEGRVREIESQVQKGLGRALQSVEKHLARQVVEGKAPAEQVERVRRDRNAIADDYDRLFVSFPLLEQNLQQQVKEKLCLVGLTATATTDLCATPIQEQYPGMGVHANLANTLVSGEFLHRLDWTAPALCLVYAVLLMLLLPRVTILQGVSLTIALVVLHVGGSVIALCMWQLLIPMVVPVIATLATYMAITVHRYFGEEREKQHIRRTFEDFMDSKMVDRLLDDRSLWTEIGGTTRNITAMFSDLQGFTTVSEALGVDQLSDLLTAYLDAMTDVIIRHDGIREKYIGDAIASFFGAPLPYTDHPGKACLAALEQREVLVELRKKWIMDGVVWYQTMRSLGLELSTRIGVNSGPAKVGNFGAKGMRYYMMMGDTVTLSSRLEGANKRYGTSILVSGSTFVEAQGVVEAREVDMIRVKGRAEPVSIHELVCVKGLLTSSQSELLERFAAALAKYRARAWLPAREIFEGILARFPEDGPTREYVRRLRDLSWVETLPPEWDGTYTMTEK